MLKNFSNKCIRFLFVQILIVVHLYISFIHSGKLDVKYLTIDVKYLTIKSYKMQYYKLCGNVSL